MCVFLQGLNYFSCFTQSTSRQIDVGVMHGYEMPWHILHEHHVIMHYPLSIVLWFDRWFDRWLFKTKSDFDTRSQGWVSDRKAQTEEEMWSKKQTKGRESSSLRVWKLSEKERNWVWRKTEDGQKGRSRNRNCEAQAVVDNDSETEQETEKLGMKALLREKEPFTSRPIQRDRE